jgi:hypothetical protein
VPRADEQLALDVAVTDLAAVVRALVVDDDHGAALEPRHCDGARTITRRDDAPDRHEAELVQLRPAVVRVVAQLVEELRVDGTHHATLREGSDPARAAVAQVRAILALVGDLHYLRPNVAAVLVHIDLDGERPHPSSLVALAAGRRFASSWGATLYAAMIVHAPDEKVPASLAHTQAQLARLGADKIVVTTTDALVAPLWAFVGHAWQGVLDHLRPRLVLFGADAPAACELAPRTGARIGARLLMRARALGDDVIELRDRERAFFRIDDTGAAVALVARADSQSSETDATLNDIDVIVLALPGGAETRVELAGTSTAPVAQTAGALVALGDDVLKDRKTVSDAKKLAARLGAQLVGTKAAGKTVPAGAVVDKTTPLAPELCVTIGNAELEVSGATSLIRIGSSAPKDKAADGALPGLVDIGVREIVKMLDEDAP